jgi:receptor protein-tyrosine kinase/non-specific protein-tyrosine kinase
MSRVYEALKKAEKERNKKATRFRVPTGKPVGKGGMEDKAGKQKVALTEIFKVKEEVMEDQINDLLVTFKKPLSQSADQFMKVCVRLAQSGPNGKKVLITSALPQDGKTMAAANVAIGLAKLPDAHVTIIDADLRKPGLHKVLDISVNKCLSEYLEGKASISEIYYDTPIPRLFIIPASRTAYSHPERILSLNKVQRLLKDLQAKHPTGYIVIDSSPMLHTAEPEIILKCVDHVIMVVRYGRTQSDKLQRALGLIDKQKLMGIIFNHVDQGFFSKNDYYHS